MTKEYVLSQILRTVENNAVFKEMFAEEALAKYRIVAERLSEPHAARPFRVVFCGVFSSGKTSLVNSLLDSDFRLPEGVNPVTKMVTRICGGDTVACAYRLNGRQTAIPNTYISALIQGKKQLIFDSNELIIAIPSEILQHHVELIDTPGFNDDPGGVLEQMSREAIYEADMAVMCCNSLQLGKILERDLLQELDAMMGHFSLVVTRMDNLNTREDWDAVVSQANRLMQHKGNDASVFGWDQPFVFPVITVGTQKHTADFESYFRAILADEEIKRRIRASSDSKCLALCLREMQTVFAKINLRLREELAELVRKNEQAIKQQHFEAQFEKKRFLNLMQQAKAAASEFAGYRMSNFVHDIGMLRFPESFQTDANRITNGMINGLINDIAAYSEREHLAGYNDVNGTLCRAYFSHGFSVPAPTKMSVKKRGIVGRGIATAANLASMRFAIDSGYDEVYTDYHGAAIQAVRSGPIEWVLHEWEAYLSRLHNNIRTAGFSGGYESMIENKREMLQQCETVEHTIASCENQWHFA